MGHVRKHDVQFIFRWDDDVVFKNCAKGIPEKGKVSLLPAIITLRQNCSPLLSSVTVNQLKALKNILTF